MYTVGVNTIFFVVYIRITLAICFVLSTYMYCSGECRLLNMKRQLCMIGCITQSHKSPCKCKNTYVYTCTQALALAVQQVFKFWLVCTYCISYKCAPSGLYVYIRLTLACVITYTYIHNLYIFNM